MTLALLREAGIEADGEVMDPDPYSAIMDALGEETYDEIVISTHPETRSGWLRQGLVDRVQRASGRPVEHVVVDIDSERDDVKRTLVVANQTVGGRDADRPRSSARPRRGRARFIVICPQSATATAQRRTAGDAAHAPRPHARRSSRRPGLEAVGQVVHPDPFTAIQNALQFYAPDDIVDLDLPRDALRLAARAT